MAQQVIRLTDGGEIVKTEISAFHGLSTFYCRACEDYVQVKYLCQGKSPATEESGPIYWKYLQDAKNHTIKEMSY